MKNQLIAALAAVAIMAACTQNAVDPTSAAAARLGGVTSSSVTSGTAVGNTEVIITQAQLPAAVGTYLTANYAGYTFVQAEQGTTPSGTTYYEVQFTLNGVTKELKFDAAGALLANQGGGHGGHGHSGGPSSGTAVGGNTEVIITQAQLPAAVGTYLTANYAGYTFVQAEQGTTPSGTTYYEVQFTLNGVTKELKFDAAGALLAH